jgi:hypothetical protein
MSVPALRKWTSRIERAGDGDPECLGEEFPGRQIECPSPFY